MPPLVGDNISRPPTIQETKYIIAIPPVAAKIPSLKFQLL